MAEKPITIQLGRFLSLLERVGVDQLIDSTSASKEGSFVSRVANSLRAASGSVVGAILTSPYAAMSLVYDGIKPYLKVGDSEIAKFLNNINRDPIKTIIDILSDSDGIKVINDHRETILVVLSKILGCSVEERDTNVAAVLDSLIGILGILPKTSDIKDISGLLSSVSEQLDREDIVHADREKFIGYLESFVTNAMDLATKRKVFFDDVITRLTYYPGTVAYKKIVQPNFERILSNLDQGNNRTRDMHVFFGNFRKDGSNNLLDDFVETVMQYADFSYLDVKPFLGINPSVLCNIESRSEQVKAIDFSKRVFKNVNFQCSEFGSVSFVGADLRGVNFYLAKFSEPVDFTGAIIDQETLKTLLPSIRDAWVHGVDIRLPSEWHETLLKKEPFTGELVIRRRLMEIADIVYSDIYDLKEKLNNSMVLIDIMYDSIVANAGNIAECRALCYMIVSSESRIKLIKDGLSPDGAKTLMQSIRAEPIFSSLSKSFEDPLYKPTMKQVLSVGKEQEVLHGIQGILCFVNKPEVASFLEDKPQKETKRFGEFVRTILEKRVSTVVFAKESRFGQLISSRNFKDFFKLSYFLLKNFNKLSQCYKQARPVLALLGIGNITLSKEDVVKNMVEIANILIKNDVIQQCLVYQVDKTQESQFSYARLLYLTQKFLPAFEDAEKLSKVLYKFCELVKEKELGSELQDYFGANNPLAKNKAMNELLAKAGNIELITLLPQLRPLFSSMFSQLSKNSSGQGIVVSRSDRKSFVERVEDDRHKKVALIKND